MTTITTRRFFDGTTLHGPTSIVIDDGVVDRISPHSGECDHDLVSAGLVDLQMNGWSDIDVADAARLTELSDALWREGTAHWLGTIVTAQLSTMTERLARLDEAWRHGSVPGFAGIHVEGPFLGGAPGAHDRRHIVDVDLAAISSFPDSVRIVTVAPDAVGSIEACRTLDARGTIVSAGHATPERAAFDEFVAAGASMVTHLFNGMSGLHHREGGMALWSLLDERLTLGLIADGRHVGADSVALAFRVAPSRICLVSDSVAWATERAQSRGVGIVDRAVALPDGTLAGSATSLGGCVRWAVTEAGIDLATALSAATSTPARLLGRPELGTVTVGSPCDLVFFDDHLHVVGGRRRLASPRD